MKNNIGKNKIRSYSAIASSLIAMGSTANGQIIYTDINPDSTVNIDGGFYRLDLNNDGFVDDTIKLSVGTGTAISQGVGISPADTNQGVAGTISGFYVYPLAMNAGDTVQASLTFNRTINQSMGSYLGSGNFYGNWIGVVDKYLGLKITVGTNIYYGWARLDVDSAANKFTIKDYAYNASPNAFIITGETGVGIAEQTLSNDILIYCFEKNVKIKFLNELPIESGELRITNILGQEIYHSAVIGKEMNIDLQDKKSGIYFVNIIQKNGTVAKKINLK